MFIVYAKSSAFTKMLKCRFVFFKSVLSSRSKNTGPVTGDYVKSSEMRNETLLQL